MTVFTPRSQQSKEKTAKICDYLPFSTMRLDRVAQVLSLRDLALQSEKSWTLASSLFRRSAPYTQTKIGGSIEPPIFFYFLANPREISRFRNK